MFTCLDVRTVKAKREKQLRISLNGTNIQGQFSVSSLKDKVEFLMWGLKNGLLQMHSETFFDDVYLKFFFLVR